MPILGPISAQKLCNKVTFDPFLSSPSFSTSNPIKSSQHLHISSTLNPSTLNSSLNLTLNLTLNLNLNLKNPPPLKKKKKKTYTHLYTYNHLSHSEVHIKKTQLKEKEEGVFIILIYVDKQDCLSHLFFFLL